MSRSDTWMPLYVGDYLRDTGHLTAAEHGAYLLLLMHAWTKNGVLPDDDLRLRMIAKMDAREWKASKEVIRAFFQSTDEGLRHKRLDGELANANDMIEQRRAAGKASAEKRAKARKANGTVNETTNENVNESSTTVATGQPTNDQRNGRPSPSPSQDSGSLRSPAPVPVAEPPSMRDTLWRDGVPILQRLIGQSDSRVRGFLGRLLKSANDDCAKVYRAIREAESLRPADPSAWLTAACGAGRINGRPDKHLTGLAVVAGYAPLDDEPEPQPVTIDHDEPGDLWRTAL